MDTQNIVLDPSKARELWRAYKKHQHYSEPIDREIMAAYQKIAQGKLIIRAIDSIVKAGLGPDQRPKLALLRADKTEVLFQSWANGSAYMESRYHMRSTESSLRFNFPPGAFPATAKSGRARIPLIPLEHRPKRGLANYHVLWEAVWTSAPPVDPMLLRRVGKADLWVVCAAWDLTEVERAALAARIG